MMRLLTALFGLVAIGASSDFSGQYTEVAQPRRLIIGGKVQDVNEHPYTVSLLLCSLTKNGRVSMRKCYHFCTGSLIAPDVVLTAGHCVVDDASAFNKEKPLTDLKRIRVLIGATDVLHRPANSRLVKVRDYSNAGYNTNYHFTMDNDVGLFFLSECLSPRKYPFITVPTPDRSLDDGCQDATILGWGKHKSVPNLLYKTDGYLRSYTDRIQPYQVCRESYVEIASSRLPRGLRQAVPLTELYNTISPDRHLCHGGHTPVSTCFGDSGGPVVVYDTEKDDLPVVIGVTSFGPGQTCGSSPSYLARISTYAVWIEKMIIEKSAGCKYDSSKIFTSYPLTERRQSGTDRTGRCPSGRWQCQYSGMCIDIRNVCDGHPHCDDGSDEFDDVCLGEKDAANTDDLPPPIEIVAGSMGLGIVQVDEEGNLVLPDDQEEAAEEEDGMDIAQDGTVDDRAEDDGPEVAISDILIDGIYLNTRLFSKWREENEAVLIAYTECPTAFGLITHVRDTHCSDAYSAVKQSVKRAGDNPRSVVPKNLLGACSALNTCIGEPQSKLLIKWIKHCNKAPHSVLRPPQWISGEFNSHLKFCKDADEYFEEESQRVPAAEKFARKYAGACPAASP